MSKIDYDHYLILNVMSGNDSVTKAKFSKKDIILYGSKPDQICLLDIKKRLGKPMFLCWVSKDLKDFIENKI